VADVDPRELTAGYAFANRNLSTAWGVLRDGRSVVWTCSKLAGHRAHAVPLLAGQCAEAELERRREGAKAVLWLAHCVPCWAYWDLGLVAGKDPEDQEPGGLVYDLLRGICPQCAVPFTRTRVAVLEVVR
jgi:hypothetical protein